MRHLIANLVSCWIVTQTCVTPWLEHKSQRKNRESKFTSWKFDRNHTIAVSWLLSQDDVVTISGAFISIFRSLILNSKLEAAKCSESSRKTSYWIAYTGVQTVQFRIKLKKKSVTWAPLRSSRRKILGLGSPVPFSEPVLHQNEEGGYFLYHHQWVKSSFFHYVYRSLRICFVTCSLLRE